MGFLTSGGFNHDHSINDDKICFLNVSVIHPAHLNCQFGVKLIRLSRLIIEKSFGYVCVYMYDFVCFIPKETEALLTGGGKKITSFFQPFLGSFCNSGNQCYKTTSDG